MYSFSRRWFCEEGIFKLIDKRSGKNVIGISLEMWNTDGILRKNQWEWIVTVSVVEWWLAINARHFHYNHLKSPLFAMIWMLPSSLSRYRSRFTPAMANVTVLPRAITNACTDNKWFMPNNVKSKCICHRSRCWFDQRLGLYTIYGYCMSECECVCASKMQWLANFPPTDLWHIGRNTSA